MRKPQETQYATKSAICTPVVRSLWTKNGSGIIRLACCGALEITVALIDQQLAARFFELVENDNSSLNESRKRRIILKKIEESLKEISIVLPTSRDSCPACVV